MQGRSCRLWTRPSWVLSLLAAAAMMLICLGGKAEPHFRTLSGKVTDGREPLKGAVVLLRQESTDSIQSYITDADGHYHFRRLDPEADYNVWAQFRGRRAPSRAISRFDSHLDKSIDLVIRNR